MRGREITLWLDDRWYDALSKHLKGETLEEHLENVLDEMCNQLPQQEYERISHELWAEQQAEDMHRSFRWKISTCILQAISMQLVRQIICLRQ